MQFICGFDFVDLITICQDRSCAQYTISIAFRRSHGSRDFCQLYFVELYGIVLVSVVD